MQNIATSKNLKSFLDSKIIHKYNFSYISLVIRLVDFSVISCLSYV